jgi:ArsR family transcriptional regulator
MAYRKDTEFTEADQRIAETAKALGHPARIAILRVLAERGTCICGEIVEVLPLAQSTVSQHLKALKEAGLIQGEIEGPRTCYCIDWEVFSSSVEALNALTAGMRKCQDARCC